MPNRHPNLALGSQSYLDRSPILPKTVGSQSLFCSARRVWFKFYRDRELWYETDDGFEFPVPIADTGTGIFKAEDGAIQYMRWIRKQLAARAEWERERREQARNLAPS